MTLPASGTISMSQVNTEIGVSSTATISLNDAAVRSLFGKASGTISLSDGWGKANAFVATITTNQQELNLATWASANGWNGSSNATITINAGVYIWSDNTSVAGLTTGSFPGGLTIVNNGFIIGKGGNGQNNNPGLSGGPAISMGVNATITNNTGAYIAGGGGGGGHGAAAGNLGGSGGGGSGGGVGGLGMTGQAGGAGGAIGTAGSDGTISTNAGGGGGRILPGTGGASVSVSGPAQFGAYVPGKGGGSGGSGGGFKSPAASGSLITGAGGSGGSVGGNATSSGSATAGGGGGGWGASGGSGNGSGLTQSAGGAGGKAIALNGFVATLSGSGISYGIVS